MLIEDKVQKIKDYLSTQSITVTIKKEADLSMENPGSYKSGVISIFDGLPSELVPEAEAHELCHAILEYRGVLSIDINDEYGAMTISKPNVPLTADILKEVAKMEFKGIDICDENNDELNKYCDLSAKITNAIHHKVMMPVLYDEFDIQPIGYYYLMYMWLAKTEYEINNHNYDAVNSYTLGVFLYDLSNILKSKAEEIARIASINPEVQKAYLASISHFNRLDVAASLAEQFKVVCEFLNVLGIESERYAIYDFYHRSE